MQQPANSDVVQKRVPLGNRWRAPRPAAPPSSHHALSPLPPSAHPAADVVNIEKSGDSFRLMYDIKGRFVLHAVGAAEAGFKLCRISKVSTSPKGIPFVVTHDGRTIRYPDPEVKVGDSAKVDLESGKITEFVKFEVGNTVMVTKGRNTGRVGTLIQRDAHPGSFDIVHVRDAEGNTFATRIANVFVIGKGGDPKDALVSLPRGKGIKRTIFEVRAGRAGGGGVGGGKGRGAARVAGAVPRAGPRCMRQSASLGGCCVRVQHVPVSSPLPNHGL